MNGLSGIPMNGVSADQLNGVSADQLNGVSAGAADQLNGGTGVSAGAGGACVLPGGVAAWPRLVTGWPAFGVAQSAGRTETRGGITRVCQVPPPLGSQRASNGRQRGPSYWTQIAVRGAYLGGLNQLPLQGLHWLAAIEQAAAQAPGGCWRNGDLLVFLVPRERREQNAWRRGSMTRCRLLVNARHSEQLTLPEAVRLWCWRAGLLQPVRPAGWRRRLARQQAGRR